MKVFVLVTLQILITSFISFSQKEITLEDIWQDYKFYPNSMGKIYNMNDGEHYVIKNFSKDLYRYSYTNSKDYEVLFSADSVVDMDYIHGYKFSSDESLILLSTNIERVYRYSRNSNYFIYDRKKDSAFNITNTYNKQQIAEISPNNKYVAFIENNNLYYRDLFNDSIIAVTKDGKNNKIINGLADWVYEEEFKINKAFFWSEDGTKIAYLKFNEEKVKEYSFNIYNSIYPEQYTYKYPKAGEENSIVSVHVYDIETQKTITFDIGKETDIYIPRINWTKNSNNICITKLNRKQDKIDLLYGNTETGETKVIYTEKEEFYIDIHSNLEFINDKEYIWTSKLDNWNHIYLLNVEGNKKQITKGEWDVTDIYGYDEKTNKIYYQSTEESLFDRDIYVIDVKTGEKSILSPDKGTNRAIFSKGFKYMVCENSKLNTPSSTFIYNIDGSMISRLPDTDNSLIEKFTKDYGFVNKELFSFLNSDSVTIHGYIMRPEKLKKKKKYPVFINVYGGPGSQSVKNEWEGLNNAWYQMLVKKGYIIVCIDGRGTGFRGQDFEQCTYKNLGELETLDIIETAKHLSTKKYVDKDRIGIWGWSYGGYLSALALTKGSDYFKMAISVAPVTDWSLYDNIYTERYMCKPIENEEGYKNSSVLSYTDSLKGNFLLVHGTADDNVHMYNSIALSKSLIKANKQFDVMYYPNSNHGIYTGRNTRLHLYRKMTDFILNNL